MKGSCPTSKCSPDKLGREVAERPGAVSRLTPACTPTRRAAAFNQTIAYSGPIEIVGDQMQTKVDVSWNEAWTNTVQARHFKFIGANLSLISAWAPSPFDPSIIIRGILEWKREA